MQREPVVTKMCIFLRRTVFCVKKATQSEDISDDPLDFLPFFRGIDSLRMGHPGLFFSFPDRPKGTPPIIKGGSYAGEWAIHIAIFSSKELFRLLYRLSVIYLREELVYLRLFVRIFAIDRRLRKPPVLRSSFPRPIVPIKLDLFPQRDRADNKLGALFWVPYARGIFILLHGIKLEFSKNL